MARRLRPASLYAHRHGSVLVPVNLLAVPERIVALEQEWDTKHEHHVTAVDTPAIAQRLGRPVGDVWHVVAEALGGRRAGPVRVGDELRLVEHEGERTIVLMAGVDGLRELYEELSARLGTPLDVPPTHITLCVAPDGAAIGIPTAADLHAWSRPLRAAEDAEVRGALRLDEVLAAAT